MLMNSSDSNKSRIIKQSLWQAPVLLVLAALLAIGTNSWRAEGIPLVGDWSVEARYADASGDSPVIAPELAEMLFEQDTAVFLDARPHDQFLKGHIRGALSVPWQDVDDYFDRAADRLNDEKAIIVYCDGESCDLSHELSLFLKAMGYENVHVLVNGWTVWQKFGLPVDSGK
jgi:rhodanese-related sulfurtransferase